LLDQPELSFLAVTISYGEAHPALYIQHMGAVLDTLGFGTVPLGAGQDMPLAVGTPFPDWLRQISDRFWDVPIPNTGKTYPVQDAPGLMVSVINQSAQPVTIFLSGTFTNLAQALRLDPGISDNISAVYFMGGAVNVPGNITNLLPDSDNLVAEWNIITDPLAAQEVFASGLPLFMVPLDATNKVILDQADLLPWHQGNEKAQLTAELYDVMFNNYGFTSAEIFDLTAAVIMVNPDTCVFQPFHLEVVTQEGPSLGQTRLDPNSSINISACLKPDAALVLQDLNETFSP
jgi:inosine-uridine nucleoside N-ribohydrolase